MISETMLKEYAIELGIDHLSLETLIDSHRYLRSELEKMMNIESAAKISPPTKSSGFSAEQLKNMTVKELIDLFIK
jgi:hypothetical protein